MKYSGIIKIIVGLIIVFLFFMRLVNFSSRHDPDSESVVETPAAVVEQEVPDDPRLNDLYSFKEYSEYQGTGDDVLEDKVFYLEDYEGSPQLTANAAYEYGINSSDAFIVECIDGSNYICRFVRD